MADSPAPNPVTSAARRVMVACGLCFTLLFVTGMCGAASITLLYDDPLYNESIKGIEGATLSAVVALKGFITFMHTWGGYAGILLAGWSMFELLRFARVIRRSDNQGWKSTARWLGPAGVAGSVLIAGSLVALLASGVAAKGYGDHIASYEFVTETVEGKPGEHDAKGMLQGYPDSGFAELHVRELNMLLALGAIVLVMATASVRRIGLEARKAPQIDGTTK